VLSRQRSSSGQQGRFAGKKSPETKNRLAAVLGANQHHAQINSIAAVTKSTLIGKFSYLFVALEAPARPSPPHQ
jgi:hypothetical protein